MSNELTISLKINSDGSAVIQQTTGDLGGLRQEAGNTGSALTKFSGDAQSAGEAVRRALEFAGITVGLGALAYKVKEFYGEVLAEGARTEMLKGSAYAIAQYYQVSGQAVDYFVNKLEKAGITEQNAFYGVSKFLAGGLNLELIPALARAAKNLAPLAPEGKTVNEEFKGLVTTISSGMPRGLKEFGIQMGNVLGDAGRSLKQLDDEMSMTSVERAQATLTYVLNYAEKVKYVGDETASAYARQQAQLQVEATRAKEALFETFKPLASAITGEKIQAWQDINRVIGQNREAFREAGETGAIYVGRLANAVKTVISFASAHQELLRALLEYKSFKWGADILVGVGASAVSGISSAAQWYRTLNAEAMAAATGTTALTAANTANTASIVANTAATAVASEAKVLYRANVSGAVVETIALTNAAGGAAPAISRSGAAAGAASTAFAGWLPNIIAVAAALLALGAINLKRQVEKTPSLVETMGVGEAWGTMSVSDQAAMQERGIEADQVADARRWAQDYRQRREEVAQLKADMELYRQEFGDMAAGATKKAQDEAKANQPNLGEKGKGGAGLDAAQNRLENFIQTMRQQTAQAAGDSIKAADAWYKKESVILLQIEEKAGESEEARTALKTAHASKRGKIEEEYSLLVAKESGNAYAEIEAQAKKWLNTYQGIAGAEAAIDEIKARKIWEVDVKNYSERLTLEKSFFDQAAQLTPVISEQIGLKRKSLDLEIKLGDYALYTKLAQLQTAKQITAAEADQYRAEQALLDQAKRYKFEMENDRGFAGWAYTRSGEASARDKDSFKSLMGGAENYLQSGFSSALDGVLSKDKTKLQNIGKTMWQGFIGESFKGGITRGFDALAKLAAPQNYSWQDLGSGKGLQVGDKLSKAADNISTKFAANAAQFGVAAGGLLLSGVGIATNSQALVYAGTVLNLAGVAIQLYQALTATEQTSAAAALSGSAGALYGAAIALKAAAGSSSGGGLFESIMGSIPVVGGVFKSFLGSPSGAGSDSLVGISNAYSPANFTFHKGSEVAHAGLYIAHNGLAPDERWILAQLGEGVIKRSAMQAYAQNGVTFDELNDDSLPLLKRRRLLALSERDSDAGSTVNHVDNRQAHVHIHIHAGAVKTSGPVGGQEMRELVRRHILPEINTQLKRFGFSIGGS